jgi:localization factor PodJL
MEALEQAHAYFQAAAFHGTEQVRELPSPAQATEAADHGGIGAEIQQVRSALRGEFPAQSGEAESLEGIGPNADDGGEAALPMQASREDFLAAARRAARKASSEPADERAELIRPAVRARAASGDRRGTGSRPVTGLVVATLAVVLAVGIGLTTYSIYRGTLKSPLSVEGSVLAPAAEHSALGLDDESIVEGAPAGGGDVDAQANREATASGSSETPDNVPEIVIDDLPVAPSVPDVDNESPRSRTVTGLPGGIMLDTGSVASTEDIARIHRQRSLAQLSTSLGAAQAGVASIPAALIPQSAPSSPAVTTPQSRQSGAGNRIMPPASVGPLSLRLAAANGDPSAEFEVAVRLAEGRGVNQDLKEAVNWYQRSAARGFAPAQYRLGTLYERGIGVDADRGRAMAWYRSAAEKGNLKAMHNLAVLNASADPANFRVAAHWFAEAAARGLGDSQYNLAVLFETGRGVDRDLKQAYMWFALAARGGDKEAVRRRDRVKLMLDAAQLKSAEALVRSWKQATADPLVNDARAAGEAWKQRETQS